MWTDTLPSCLLGSSPTLHAKFGDYRRPSEFQIGVGDVIVVTIWEAGSSGMFASTGVGQLDTTIHSTVIPEQVVDEAGTIEIPYVGRVKVS